MPDNSLRTSSLAASGGSVLTYERRGLHLSSQPIEEFSILDRKKLAANTTYSFNFADLGVALRLVSLYGFDAANVTANNMTFRILDADNQVFYERVFTFAEFSKVVNLPFFTTLMSGKLTISVTNPIDRLVIYGRPVIVSFNDFPQLTNP